MGRGGGAIGAGGGAVEAEIKRLEDEYGTGEIDAAQAEAITNRWRQDFRDTPEGQAVDGIQQSWSASSNIEGGHVMHEWAATRFGYRGTIWTRRNEEGQPRRFSGAREIRRFNDGYTFRRQVAPGYGRIDRETAFRGLDRQYAFTQYILGRQGVPAMTLYRGIGGRSLGNTVNRIPAGGTLRATVGVNPTSSWSGSTSAAVNFARSAQSRTRPGVVLSTRLPRSDILFTQRTAVNSVFQHSFRREMEVVPVMRGRATVNLQRVADFDKRTKGRQARGVLRLNVHIDASRSDADWLK